MFDKIKDLFPAIPIFAAVVGAFLSGIVGVITAIMLDKIRAKREKRNGAKIILGELKWIVDSYDKTIREGAGKLICRKLVHYDILLNYYTVLDGYLESKGIDLITDIYREFVDLDGLMEDVKKSADNFKYVGLEEYWRRLQDDEIKEKVERTRVIIDILKDKLRGK